MSACVHVCRRVFTSARVCPRVFACVRVCSRASARARVCPRVSACFVLVYVTAFVGLYPHLSACVQCVRVFSNVFAFVPCYLVFPHVSACVHVFPGVSACVRV